MQQINLYQAEFQPKKIVLSPHQILLTVLFFIALFSLISFYHCYKNSLLAEEIAQAEQHQQHDIVKPEDNSPLLRAELASLQKKNTLQQSFLSYLTKHDLGNQRGFSSLLTNLSQQRIHNVWLTSFSFLEAGKSITLDGEAVESSQIPLYIDNLARSEQFQGKQFSVFKLEQDKDTNFYTFKLHTNNKMGK